MKISLILPTLNRTDDLELFLDSLLSQTYKNFELIVIDQNKSNEIKEIIDKYLGKIEIKYIKSDVLGISINRNKGLFYRSGEIIGFPDDDCTYAPDTLQKVVNYLIDKQRHIYSCRTLEKGKNYGTGVMFENDCEIKIGNVEKTVKSITFFVNIKEDDIYLFDNKLGVGSIFGSGEETDYILTLLHKGYKGEYFANDIIYHPAKKGNYDDLNRAYNYARGYGALCKKEVIYRKNYLYIFKFLNKIIRSIGGCLISKHGKYHGEVLRGRLSGFFGYKND
ncbi:glycosyltransferase family 2 protein [Caviibacter abscessus]|uniref:glycosyltransferase family 2 protein n=1 Tax=Caviibacter abscessus TaxID=1766719 RepID=UPI000832B567|nr:glycosyltransferase family 2 protein [Caviibacter abscessus]